MSAVDFLSGSQSSHDEVDGARAAGSSETQQSGSLSIESRNVFTILKKWLYTEQGVVFRELVSNASDAINKLGRLIEEGVYQAPAGWAGRIDVAVDAKACTLTISDNGLGMTADEVERYINRIAFSGATDFVDQFSGDDRAEEAIIGHFGVGFYSAFMISDSVTIDTKSYLSSAPAVHWHCDAEMSFTMAEVPDRPVGTTITLQLDEASPYLTDRELAATALRKYFAFLSTPIHYTFLPEPSAEHLVDSQTPKQDASPHDYRSELINDPDPIWARPSDQVDPAELKAFYRSYFGDEYDPLFWVRVNSPDLGLRGIIFFRNTRRGTEELDGRVDVLSRGVYIESNARSLIPKFVNLQSGIIECDRLPLVVSRSQVRSEDSTDDIQELIFECLTQEMSITFHEMFTQHRSDYERFWPEVGPFVKYGVLTDRTFASVMGRRMLFQTLDDKFLTLAEYLPLIEPIRANTVFYSSDPEAQSFHIDIFRRNGIPALMLDHVIDQPLMRRLEMTTKGVTFQRLDADMVGVLQVPLGPEDEPMARLATDRFREVLGDELGEVGLRSVALRDASISTLITMDEATRRMGDMMEIYGLVSGVGPRADTVPRTLLINITNPLVGRAVGLPERPHSAAVIRHLFELALLNQGELDPSKLPGFLRRSEEILEQYLG